MLILKVVVEIRGLQLFPTNDSSERGPVSGAKSVEFAQVHNLNSMRGCVTHPQSPCLAMIIGAS